VDRPARVLLVLALVFGAALRLYPLGARYLHPDQEVVPDLALGAFAKHDWTPTFFMYPNGFWYLVRATYTVAYAGARLADTGVHDRLDVVAAFVADPFPFLLVPRVWASLFGIATIAFTAQLARRVVDAWGASLAALFLATSFLAVRESHYGSHDAPGTALFTATLACVAMYVGAPSRRRLVGAGVLAGLTTAVRYQLGVVALAIPVAALFTPGRTSRRATDIAMAAGAAMLAFAVLSPYSIRDAGHVWTTLRGQLAQSWSASAAPPGLPLATALDAAVGPVTCALAAIGLVAGLRRRPRTTAALLAAALPYALMLASAHRSFVRYALPLVPLLCVFGAGGVRALATLVPTRLRTGMTAMLVLAAIGDPALRSIALDRVLATEDTRIATGRWLAANASEATMVWLPSLMGYTNPSWGTGLPFAMWQLDRPLVEAATRRHPVAFPTAIALDGLQPRLDVLRQKGGIVVTASHPLLPEWAAVPPEVDAVLRERGAVVVARFYGIDPSAPRALALYEPIDANFVPLRGLDLLSAPGPNLTVWRVPPAP
jgi:hypothetical protein